MPTSAAPRLRLVRWNIRGPTTTRQPDGQSLPPRDRAEGPEGPGRLSGRGQPAVLRHLPAFRGAEGLPVGGRRNPPRRLLRPVGAVAGRVGGARLHEGLVMGVITTGQAPAALQGGTKMAEKKHWMQGAVKHPGALRATLGVKAGHDIPAAKL